jgi:NAD(P)-dependent dehydrogenase (short-subunit alcohol dehydrogenase family)
MVRFILVFMDNSKVAVVTGANRGIGREVVRQLAQRGYTVVLGARDLKKGEEAVREIGNNVVAMQLNVADDASVERFMNAVAEHFGRLDVLVNNAGTMYDSWQKAENADLAKAHEGHETNLWGAWRMAKAAVPLMRNTGKGRIVNVSSQMGSLTNMSAGPPAYATSKAALNALTRILAAELKGDGILVNSVCPGWVRTEMGGQGAPRSVEQGASSVMWAVNLPDHGPTGGFYQDGKPLPW